MAYGPKASAIRRMFGQIALRYDLLNNVLSVNQHHGWRRRSVRAAALAKGERVLDVATGTADFALELARAVGAAGQVIAADFCEPILSRGVQKVARRGWSRVVRFTVAAAEALPYPESAFSAATIGFALRNVTSVERTIQEMRRVVRPGGRVVTLELTRPEAGWFRRFHDWYAGRIIPLLGGWLSGRRDAYTYLPESIAAFMSPQELTETMQRCGLTDVKVYRLTGGVATLHVGVKPGDDRCP